MRLVCPSCEAKYEVPDDAIPDTGRDVQCANCGHSWFQMRPRPAVAAPSAVEAAAVSEPAPVSEPPAEIEASPVIEDVAEAPAPAEPVDEIVSAEADPVEDRADTADLPEAAGVPDDQGDPEQVPQAHEADIVESAAPASEPEPPVAESADAPEADEDPDIAADAAPAEPEAATASAPAPYAVDDSVLAILREEAEREAQARRAEASPLETQESLGIEAAIAAKPKLVAVAVDSDSEAGAKPSARRDLLPDVEEINSTLRPSEQSVDEGAGAAGLAAPAREARGGFRSGFLMMMTLSILGAAVYIGAPRLSVMIPSLADPLGSYVMAVDALRHNLDGMMRSATVALNGE